MKSINSIIHSRHKLLSQIVYDVHSCWPLPHLIHKWCIDRKRVSPVEQNHHEHDEVEKAIENDDIQRQLVLLEKRLALLHVDVDKSWPCQRDELVFVGEQVQLVPVVQLEVMDGYTAYFDGVGVGYEAFEPDFHLLALAKSFLDEVGLTLQED